MVARRVKYGESPFVADQAHLHYRFLRRGYSQRRATVYLYAWCAVLAGAALATRFVPFRAGGQWHLWPTVFVLVIAVVTAATSLYIVILLEILKLRRLRAWAQRRRARGAVREVPRARGRSR